MKKYTIDTPWKDIKKATFKLPDSLQNEIYRAIDNAASEYGMGGRFLRQSICIDRSPTWLSISEHWKLLTAILSVLNDYEKGEHQ